MSTTEWWVDGHYISADGAEEARAEAARIFEYEPEAVRPWTAADDEALGFDA